MKVFYYDLKSDIIIKYNLNYLLPVKEDNIIFFKKDC